MTEHFDRDPELHYLNSGTQSLLPRQVLEAVIAETRSYERNPTRALFETWPRLWQTQKRLAAFFGARPQDLFLRPNVTEALNTAILGFKLPAGGEILLSDLEYGAVANLCRFRAERDGLGLRSFRIGHAEPVQDVIGALRPETRMLVLSHVMTGNGLLLPIREIARETRRRGVLLVVDGAHALGALPVAFSELDDVDAYGTNLHKWMMGPKGTGFGWVPERHHGMLVPSSAGWTTYETPQFFGEFGEGSHFPARLAMQGCQDFAPFQAISAMLDFWEQLGADRIRRRLHELQAEVERQVEKQLGWERLSPPAGPCLGPLVSYLIPEPWQSDVSGLMFRLLEETGVQISVTGVHGRWGVRFSPHIHCSEAEIQRAVTALAGFFRGAGAG